MFTRKELEKRIAKRTEEVVVRRQNVINAQLDLATSEAYLQALEDMRKLCPEERSAADQATDSLRENSDMAKARDAIRAAAKPLHINEIMKAIGMEATPKKKTSFAGSLSAYARKGKIFTRPAANTFGLIELQQREPEPVEETEKEGNNPKVLKMNP